MRDQDVNLTATLLTLAGAMFVVSMLILTPTRLITDDVPEMMLSAGLCGAWRSVRWSPPRCSPVGRWDRHTGKHHAGPKAKEEKVNGSRTRSQHELKQQTRAAEQHGREGHKQKRGRNGEQVQPGTENHGGPQSKEERRYSAI